MKKVLSFLLAAMMTVSLAACGGSGGSSGSSEPSGAADAGKTLNVAIWDNNQLAGLQQIADDWSKTSGVKVQMNVISWNEYWTLLEAGASGGALPDVFWMHINEAEKYMDNGVLLNLDQYIAGDDAVDLNNYYEGIVKIYSHNGSQFALPKDHDTIALLYNKEIFDRPPRGYQNLRHGRPQHHRRHDLAGGKPVPQYAGPEHHGQY